VVKDIEGKVMGETIMEDGKVMCFVLKDLYGKIKKRRGTSCTKATFPGSSG
jgi:hypothetical protein